MRYFFTEALIAQPDDKETIKTELLASVAIASQVCNYRHPKLATVKVGGDRENPLLVREGVTSKQIMEELRQKIMETGLLPSKIASKQVMAELVAMIEATGLLPTKLMNGGGGMINVTPPNGQRAPLSAPREG